MHVLPIARRAAPIEAAAGVDRTEGRIATHVVGVVGGDNHPGGGIADLDAVETQCFAGELRSGHREEGGGDEGGTGDAGTEAKARGHRIGGLRG